MAWCLSIRSGAKFLPQVPHWDRSSRGLDANRDRRASGLEDGFLVGLADGCKEGEEEEEFTTYVEEEHN